MDKLEAALSVERLALAEIELDPENARAHGDGSLTALKDSLTRFGQRKPVVVNRRTMRVEAGNGTVQAAMELGWTHVAAVLVEDDDETAMAYALADNRSAELSEWDTEQLVANLSVLGDAAGGLGWADDELEGFMALPDFQPLDDAPPRLDEVDNAVSEDEDAPSRCPMCGRAD